MPIIPDTKDWTWVLERPCADCGFDSSTLTKDQIGPLVGTNAAAWLLILTGDPDQLRRRVHEDRWSPLEYACHVRDVFRLYDERLQLMLTLDHPTYPNWDQDKTAVDDRYNEQDPSDVATVLASAAGVLVTRFEHLHEADWGRRGSRSDGADFTVDTFGRYMVHDPIHHLHDVTVDPAEFGPSAVD